MKPRHRDEAHGTTRASCRSPGIATPGRSRSACSAPIRGNTGSRIKISKVLETLVGYSHEQGLIKKRPDAGRTCSLSTLARAASAAANSGFEANSAFQLAPSSARPREGGDPGRSKPPCGAVTVRAHRQVARMREATCAEWRRSPAPSLRSIPATVGDPGRQTAEAVTAELLDSRLRGNERSGGAVRDPPPLVPAKAGTQGGARGRRRSACAWVSALRRGSERGEEHCAPSAHSRASGNPELQSRPQQFASRVPAFAGTSGGRSELRHHSAHSRASGKSRVAVTASAVCLPGSPPSRGRAEEGASWKAELASNPEFAAALAALVDV